MFKRSSGILMHITSLPGKFGIGTLGKEAKDFVRFLNESGFSHWQVLPLGPTSEYNSPYQCYSAFAGNIYMIDIDELKEDGLLTKEEADSFQYKGSPYEADFKWQRENKSLILEKAFNRITPKMKEEIDAFVESEEYWIKDYALYISLKNKYDQLPWWEWPEDIRRYETDAVETARTELEECIEYIYFCQYLFFKQWGDLKKHANSSGVELIGDMPIYVSKDSADIWSKSKLFEINKDHSLKNVAGVPPDYFSSEGQLWGNPLYNWSYMKDTGYEWWIKRIEMNLKMFDSVRIDHFRGFVAYWSVPAQSRTAKDGSWVKGPGAALFDAVKLKFPKGKIIAEDLGDITDDVREFVDYTGFPGMRVMQFAFLDDNDNYHLPHNYNRNSVAYTGTHDNNTVLGWMWEATSEQRERAIYYCGFSGDNWGDGGSESSVIKSWFKTLFSSCSDLVIIPIQDVCGFGGDTRINRPGIAEGNWSFRIVKESVAGLNTKELRRMNHAYKRI